MQRRLPEKRQVKGAIAQLGERLPCTQEVGGSIPPGSTNYLVSNFQELELSNLRITQFWL